MLFIDINIVDWTIEEEDENELEDFDDDDKDDDKKPVEVHRKGSVFSPKLAPINPFVFK